MCQTVTWWQSEREAGAFHSPALTQIQMTPQLISQGRAYVYTLSGSFADAPFHKH